MEPYLTADEHAWPVIVAARRRYRVYHPLDVVRLCFSYIDEDGGSARRHAGEHEDDDGEREHGHRRRQHGDEPGQEPSVWRRYGFVVFLRLVGTGLAAYFWTVARGRGTAAECAKAVVFVVLLAVDAYVTAVLLYYRGDMLAFYICIYLLAPPVVVFMFALTYGLFGIAIVFALLYAPQVWRELVGPGVHEWWAKFSGDARRVYAGFFEVLYNVVELLTGADLGRRPGQQWGPRQAQMEDIELSLLVMEQDAERGQAELRRAL